MGMSLPNLDNRLPSVYPHLNVHDWTFRHSRDKIHHPLRMLARDTQRGTDKRPYPLSDITAD